MSAWPQETGSPVTPELLQNRVAAARDSTELDEATRARLIDLYRQSISNLEARRANEESAEEYREARRRAPVETEKIRVELERRRATDPMAELQPLSSRSSQQLNRLLDEEVANLAAVEARLAGLEAMLESAARRPADARARIATARSRMEALAAATFEPRAPGEHPQITEATRWARETGLEALRTEIVMLDEELLSHGARNGLLRARREAALESVDRIGRRIEALRSAVSERRREEAELAMTQARAALAGVHAAEPLVRELAESNLELVEVLQAQLAELDRVETRERERPRTSQIESAFRSARRKLELEGWRAPVGMAILAERRQFPGATTFSSERRLLSRSITGVSLRLTEAEEERRTLNDVGAYLDERIAAAGGADPDSSVRGELENLVQTRRSLLDRAIANDVALQRRLYDLDDALRTLTDRITAYDEFLARRLLWVRSTRAIDAEALAGLPAELDDYLAADRWQQSARLAAHGLVRLPVYSLIVLLALGLFWRRRRIRASLVECGDSVGLEDVDSMRSTFRALAFTLMLAAPLPLAVAALGGALSSAEGSAGFPQAVGATLLRAVSWLALPMMLRSVFLPHGLADRHFGWGERTVVRLRRQLTWFIGLTFPVYVVLKTSLVVEPPPFAGGTLTFLCFVVIMIGFLALIVAIGHPTRGSARPELASRSGGAQWRWRYLWFPLGVLMSVALILLGWLGYSYTAEELMRRLFLTIWSLVTLWLGAAMARRWLLLTETRLARQEAQTAPDASSPERVGSAEGTAGTGGASDTEVDLVALGDDSRRLLSAVVLLAVALSLAGIWGDVFPALGILGDIDLWTQTALIEGVEQVVPVTLLDLLLAVVSATAGYILARNVPSLLDIILLKHGGVSTGTRYTVGTLARYAITATTVLVVLQQLGASASQLGWAAAALGVGIGFGLQEIVANFICGLIVLFERPIRVGDVITIGDASGEVKRIRIRATTIRDWEEKELVIPNKELITGRLLNWTLSDAVIRVYVRVGVAYGSDVDHALALMREAADENPRVLSEPEPRVHFEEFGDSSLQLSLRAYIGDVSDRLPAATELHRAINAKFRGAGIVIAFPQRDVHLRYRDDGAARPIEGDR